MPEPIYKTLGKRAPDGAYELSILGDIGFFGIEGADLIRELNAVKPDTVKFLIHSPGGAVYDAIAVAGYIQEKGIECYAEIYGTCMSAATVFAALAGPKRTSIAAGSMFLVHMPYGGDQKAIDNAADYMVELYSKSYGWTKAEARKHMEADNGLGVFWTADEAKELGVVSEVMKLSLAAYHKQKHTAMAEKTNTIKASAKVKLTGLEAVRAALGEGTEVEVEVNVDEATAKAIEEKDKEIADLKSENEALKAEEKENEEADEALKTAQDEATQAKAEVETLKAKHTKEVEDLKAAHVKAIADLKKPVAKAVTGNNDNPAPGAQLNPTVDPNVEAVKAALKGAKPVKK